MRLKQRGRWWRYQPQQYGVPAEPRLKSHHSPNKSSSISVPDYQADPTLTVPHPGTRAVPSVGKFTFPEMRISRSGGCECPISHGVKPFFLYDHKLGRVLRSREEIRLTKPHPSLRSPRLLSTLLGSPRAISSQSWGSEFTGRYRQTVA